MPFNIRILDEEGHWISLQQTDNSEDLKSAISDIIDLNFLETQEPVISIKIEQVGIIPKKEIDHDHQP